MAELSRLPGPVMDLWEWQFEGACRDQDDTMFFHPEGERGAARRRRIEAAKAVLADNSGDLEAIAVAKGQLRAVERA